MFFYTRLALVTCAFYIGAAVLMDVAMFGMTMWKGSFAVLASKPVWSAFFGIVWFGSFLASWRIVIVPILDQIHRLRGSVFP